MSGFTVMPMSQMVSLKPGEVYEGKLRVSNPQSSKEDFHYKLSVVPYSVVDQDYTADLDTITDWSQMAGWISFDEPTGVIPPNEVKEVTFRITVPKSAPAGGQYAAVTVSSDKRYEAEQGLALHNIYEMASIIYADVAGKTVHEGEIVENNIPGFVTSLPLTIGAMIVNTGNVHDTAEVTIRVQNNLTNEVIFPRDGVSGEFEEVVMPSTTRYVSREISEMPGLGVFQVTQTIKYLDQVSDLSRTVVVCPLWFLALVIMLVLAIVATVVRIVVKHRRKIKFAESS